MATESYFGAGIVYINGRDVSNASGVTFTFNTEDNSIPNYRGGGGNYASRSRISDVNLGITLYDFSDENLALALRGSSTAVTATTVSSEALTSVDGGLSATEFMLDVDQTVTVTGSGGTPTYVVDTDYTVTASGILTVTGGSIGDGTAIEVSYTKKAGSTIEALINSGTEVSIVVDLKNEAESDKPYTIKIHRFKPSPAENLSVIGDDYGNFTLTGEVLQDSTITATGKSKFFQVLKAS